MNKDIQPDPELSSEQEQIVSALTVEELVRIDRELKSLCTDRWQKMAKVVGSCMFLEKATKSKLPDIFYAQRIRKMVSDGQLESRGYIESIRFCEVKLSNDPET